MHNNYYFLRQLAPALNSTLKGAVVSECFSQNLDELVVRFEVGARPFFIRASLQPALACVSFPDRLQRARKNSVDLLTPAVGQQVVDIRSFQNERSFAIALTDDLALLFKMHGSRANVVLFDAGMVVDLFRKNMAADRTLTLDGLNREIDWSYDHFVRERHNIRKTYFTFGNVVWRFLAEQGFFEREADEQWRMLQSLLAELMHPTYYITDIEGKPVLSLVRTGEVRATWSDPLAAANEYFHAITGDFVFLKEKTAMLHALRTSVSRAVEYCKKNRDRLAAITQDDQYRAWADLIMANLHSIPPGSEKVVLNDFYDNSRPVTITLKKELTPQKNAELLYKKAKNRHIEVEKIESAIREKEAMATRLRDRIAEVEAAADLSSLRRLRDSAGREKSTEKKESKTLPYREFVFGGYRIWVGKGAGHNDTMTLKLGHKDDLWLHAKDSAGSHVLIKHQAGRNFPKDVVEFAASLAAGYSKRKNEELCAVVVTPRKFVRKRKADPPGLVVVEREEVILVPPRRDAGIE